MSLSCLRLSKPCTLIMPVHKYKQLKGFVRSLPVATRRPQSSFWTSQHLPVLRMRDLYLGNDSFGPGAQLLLHRSEFQTLKQNVTRLLRIHDHQVDGWGPLRLIPSRIWRCSRIFIMGSAAQVLAIRSLRCPSRRLHAMTLLIISDTLHAAFTRARQAPHRGA